MGFHGHILTTRLQEDIGKCLIHQNVYADVQNVGTKKQSDAAQLKNYLNPTSIIPITD